MSCIFKASDGISRVFHYYLRDTRHSTVVVVSELMRGGREQAVSLPTPPNKCVDYTKCHTNRRERGNYDII